MKQYRKLLWLLLVPVMTMTCIDIVDIIHPNDPQADSDIEIIVNIRITAETDRDNRLVFGVLAPKSWNLASNAAMTLTSTNYTRGGGNVTDLPMTVVPSGELATGKTKTWSQAFMDEFGIMGNYLDGLEWTVFETATQFVFLNGDDVSGFVKIKLRTGDENVRLFMGYAFCGKEKGLDDKSSMAKELRVTGGQGTEKDYTVMPGVLNVSATQITNSYMPMINSPAEINVGIKIDGKNACASEMAFGILALKSWNLAAAGNVTITTSGHKTGDVTNEQMTVAVGTEPVEGVLSWPEAFMNRFGIMDNYGENDFEWVVFTSQTTFKIDGESPDVTGNIKIQFTTGGENLKVNVGYAFCGIKYGFDEEDYIANNVQKRFIVGGGANYPKTNYTWDPEVPWIDPVLFSTVPSVLRYGDIFSVVFDAEGEYYEQLADEPAVYMYAEAVYNGGQVKAVEKTAMENIGGAIWQKYIYPKLFFDLPEGAVIEKLNFHVLNNSKSIVIDNGGADYHVAQSAE